MRPRFVMLCSVLSAVAFAAPPGLATAAPQHNHGLTINATPKPIQAGEGVLIYGQLKGSDIAHKTLVLYHHISDRGHPGYTVVAAPPPTRSGSTTSPVRRTSCSPTAAGSPG